MAIHQHPRENLLLEATAYTRRCLYRVPLAARWVADGTDLNGPDLHGTRADGAERREAGHRSPKLVKRPAGGQQIPDQDALMWEWLEPFQQQAKWELFIGLRADERWSIYFDEQPVLQFNCQHQLRRLFAGGQRYAANAGRLHRLDRSHLGGQVQLQQVELDDASQRVVLDVCEQFLEEAAQALRSGRAQRVGEFPADDTAWLPAFEQNLQRVASGLTLASSRSH